MHILKEKLRFCISGLWQLHAWLDFLISKKMLRLSGRKWPPEKINRRNTCEKSERILPCTKLNASFESMYVKLSFFISPREMRKKKKHEEKAGGKMKKSHKYSVYFTCVWSGHYRANSRQIWHVLRLVNVIKLHSFRVKNLEVLVSWGIPITPEGSETVHSSELCVMAHAGDNLFNKRHGQSAGCLGQR